MPETPVAAARPSAGSVAKVPVQAADNESSNWKDAASAQSPFALMAYLGKYPTGKHAEEANQLLRTAQRSSEGCLLRYSAVRKFSWSGRCRDGMAVGEGVLKWEAQRTNEAGISEAAGINEAHGTLKNGIMVGRWSIDLLRTSPKPLSVVNFVIEFDASGNVSRKQRRKYQNGGLYVGETDASMKNYLGNERHGVGVYTYPDNSRFKKLTGQWVDGNLSGEGKLEFADGTALSGYFLRGASGFDGVVKKLRPDGSIAESQVWRAGKPEGSSTSPLLGF
jgi:antitoxin component YwqK of YwqJK toxin-antitoxin module